MLIEADDKTVVFTANSEPGNITRFLKYQPENKSIISTEGIGGSVPGIVILNRPHYNKVVKYRGSVTEASGLGAKWL